MAEPELTVNGRALVLNGAGAHTTTLDWLRARGLTGSKEGCAEGECGACAVMIAQSDGSGGTAWTPVNACLLPVAALNGQEIVTAEGLGTPSTLHPVQAQLAEGGGSQCGYCTPGFACSMAAEFYRRGRSDSAGARPCDLEHGPNGFDLQSLSGNLCRCTGYRPIRDAAFGLGDPEHGDPLAARRDRPAPTPVATDLTWPDGRFIRPTGFTEVLALIAENPTADLIAGSTDLGVEVNLRGRRNALTIAIDHIPELLVFEVTEQFVEIGAALSLSEIERMLVGRVPLLAAVIPQFASRLIRNRATIGGSLGTGSPIGDVAPPLLALNARVVLCSVSGEREVGLDRYFTGYRATVRRQDELIRAIRIPLPLAPLTAFHKVAKRRYDDISAVAVAFALRIDDGVVQQVQIGIGGAAATPLRAIATEDALRGRPWTQQTVADAALVLGREGTPLTDHRASAAYRRSMLAKSLVKFFATTSAQVSGSADGGNSADTDGKVSHELAV